MKKKHTYKITERLRKIETYIHIEHFGEIDEKCHYTPHCKKKRIYIDRLVNNN